MTTHLSRILPLSVLLLASAASGCAGEDPDAPPEPDAHYEAGPFTVQAGEELVMCTYVRGTNVRDEDITAFHTEQSLGGHHLIVYTIDHDVDLPPSPCNQGGQPGWSQILVTQIEKEDQTFPTGVGFHVKAHQQYVLETHYISTSPHPLTVHTSFATTYGKPGDVEQRAATYFFGTMNIDLPPNGTAHAESACAPPEAVELHTMFGHQHQRGKGVTVGVSRAGGEDEPIYESTSWDNPPVKKFDEALALGTSDRVHVSCDWDNTDAKQVRFPHEMCFAIGYAWPAKAPFNCVSGGQKDECRCQYQGEADMGPGGGTVQVTLGRKDEIKGAGGPLDAGAPVYCALFREIDWAGLLPREGAQPRYFRDAVDVPIASGDDTIELTIQDVTPGKYKLTCMMDTIGGGFVPGTGDVVNIEAADVEAVAGKTVAAKATLDFSMP